MKSKLSIVALFSAFVAVIGLVAKLNLDSFALSRFDFMEYLVRLLALPLAVTVGLACLVFLVSLTRTGSETLAKLVALPSLSGLEFRAAVSSWGAAAWILLALTGAFAGYAAYKYGRTAYVFARDHFVYQYRTEVRAKLMLEQEYRHWDVVQERLKLAGAGVLGATNFKESTAQVKRVVDEKEQLLRQSAALEKTLGPNPKSVQLAATALSLDPWDEAVAGRIKRAIDSEFPKAVTLVAAVKGRCQDSTESSPKEIGQALVALGFARESEISPLDGRESPRERFCRLFGSWSDAKIQEYASAIWTLRDVKKILERLESTRLSEAKQATWEAWRKPKRRYTREFQEPPEGYRLERERSGEEKVNWSDRVSVPRLLPPAPRKLRTSILQGGRAIAPQTSGRYSTYQVRPPFVLRVLADPKYGRPRAIQVCASSAQWHLFNVRRGARTSQIPCFSPGTGMAVAAEDVPYRMALVVSDGDAHNYYSAERRTDRAGYSDIHIARVSLRSDGAFTGTVFVAVFLDDNQNEVLDDAEFELLVIQVR